MTKQVSAEEIAEAVKVHTAMSSANLGEAAARQLRGDFDGVLDLLNSYIDMAVEFVQYDDLSESLRLPLARALIAHLIVRANFFIGIIKGDPSIMRKPVGKELEKAAFTDVQTLAQLPGEWFDPSSRRQFEQLKYAFHLA